MKYSIVTFGCRVNQADSLAIESELASAGAEATSAGNADLVIVNTCSVTASADQGARQTIRRIARDNPRARIVATGCYASRCADEVASLPGVTTVIKNTEKAARTFVATLFDRQALSNAAGEGPCGQALAPGLMGRTAWTLGVQTGCDEACSYCIIPTTRGTGRSRPFTEIHAEVTRVADAGYKEIAITGVHLGSYGRDLDPPSSLERLMSSLVAWTEGADAEQRSELLFRISSLEPMDCTDDVVDHVATAIGGVRGGPRTIFAPHFHLPLQHASDRMLRQMKRPYSSEFYRTLVGTIRARLPHAAIGSDVIAGFPGETDDDFDMLMSFLDRSPLTHLHIFPYSDRPGTVASELPGKVHGTVVKQRAQRLREMSRLLNARFRAAQKGTTRPALTIEDGSVAVTENYFRVPAPAGHGRNEWVTVTL
jgi:threonylcarbamoyladenosine tRNA methylthiotransferase MtaB